MTEPLFMGIDGGGSQLRVLIADANGRHTALAESGGVNPSIVGRDAARAKIQATVVDALRASGTPAGQIAAVGIGVAGAANERSETWLVETLAPILPAGLLVPSSDLEIALVGALGQPHGILLLAGTGSAVYGVSPTGETLQIGGWGYLLGDEGGSFWIGSQLLKRVIREFDAGGERSMSALSSQCLKSLGLSDARGLVAWVYHSDRAPISRIAGLAALALDWAAQGDANARQILRCAASRLARQTEVMRRRFDYSEAPIAFAGGLLDHANWLSIEVARQLGLRAPPPPKHAPVVGAAMLAKLKWSKCDSA